MIVRILKSSASFNGVRYNTRKIEADKGELMKVSGFGALQAFQDLRPSDYINYLEAQTSGSSRIVNPQLHVVISARGQSKSKHELAEFAEKWMEGMGYGQQPYLLIYHKDTDNNHIHIVSTRVGRDGKKINSDYEYLRSMEVKDRIMGIDVKEVTRGDIRKALDYEFSSPAQFITLLESLGYSAKQVEGEILMYRYGLTQARVNLKELEQKITGYEKDSSRLRQLRAVFAKYHAEHDPALQPMKTKLAGGWRSVHAGFTSPMAQFLSDQFGVQVVFHAADKTSPYGYTLIDHAKKKIYKGGDLMPLAEFIGRDAAGRERSEADAPAATIKARIGRSEIPPVSPAAPPEGSHEGGSARHPEILTVNPAAIPVESHIPDMGLQIDIFDDVDDEATHGRRRRRKGKTR